jgi:hypothetical protein
MMGRNDKFIHEKTILDVPMIIGYTYDLWLRIWRWLITFLVELEVVIHLPQV